MFDFIHFHTGTAQVLQKFSDLQHLSCIPEIDLIHSIFQEVSHFITENFGELLCRQGGNYLDLLKISVLRGSSRFSRFPEVLQSSPRFFRVLRCSPEFSEVLQGSPKFSTENFLFSVENFYRSGNLRILISETQYMSNIEPLYDHRFQNGGSATLEL